MPSLSNAAYSQCIFLFFSSFRSPLDLFPRQQCHDNKYNADNIFRQRKWSHTTQKSIHNNLLRSKYLNFQKFFFFCSGLFNQTSFIWNQTDGCIYFQVQSGLNAVNHHCIPAAFLPLMLSSNIFTNQVCFIRLIRSNIFRSPGSRPHTLLPLWTWVWRIFPLKRGTHRSVLRHVSHWRRWSRVRWWLGLQ